MWAPVEMCTTIGLHRSAGDYFSFFPLLAFVASVVLCGSATSTSNESLHSVAGCVSRKLRSSMSPENVETATLAKVFWTRFVHEKTELRLLEEQAKLEGIVDESSVDYYLDWSAPARHNEDHDCVDFSEFEHGAEIAAGATA